MSLNLINTPFKYAYSLTLLDELENSENERKNKNFVWSVFIQNTSNTPTDLTSKLRKIEKYVREYEKNKGSQWHKLSENPNTYYNNYFSINLPYNFDCDDNIINMKWSKISNEWLRLIENPNIYYDTDSIPYSIYDLIDEVKERISKYTHDIFLSNKMTYLEDCDSEYEFKKYILNEIKELDKSIRLCLKLQTYISYIYKLIENPNPKYNIHNDFNDNFDMKINHRRTPVNNLFLDKNK